MLGVVPVVHRLSGVDAFVALQADQFAAGRRGQALGEFGLAHTGFAFEQKWPSQAHRQEDRGGDSLVGQIPLGSEGGTHVGRCHRSDDTARGAAHFWLDRAECSMFQLRVWAPHARVVDVQVAGGERFGLTRDARHPGAHWVGSVPDGARYRLHVDGGVGLVDPLATAVWFGEEHRRHAPDAWAVAAPWPAPRSQQRTTRPLVVAEAHARGLTMRRQVAASGTLVAAAGELPRLAELGVSVLELLPIHQFDPAEGNYWGYMPLVFGAVHGAYGSAEELAEFVEAAHRHDIEVWVDVVVNHTTEEDADGPTYNLRALAADDYYARDAAGRYIDDAGCGNIIDATSPPARRLVMAGLDRLADLGIDGFRFDLAAVLAREPDFVRDIGDWGLRRGIRLVAEPWDLARYLLGRGFPDRRWAQWNGKFRDDMRGFLRGEAGLVGAVMQRVQGSPDLFDAPLQSVNFFTAHDGFTLYDLVAYDRKRNDANGWNGADGTDDNRSWNCGWEGDIDVPTAVAALRRRQLRNAMCLLLLSHGTPMFVLGDEFGRTQGGNNNPYNQDNETSWVDWETARRLQRSRGLRQTAHCLPHGVPGAHPIAPLGECCRMVRRLRAARSGPPLAFARLASQRVVRHGKHVVGTDRFHHPSAGAVGVRDRHRRCRWLCSPGAGRIVDHRASAVDRRAAELPLKVRDHLGHDSATEPRAAPHQAGVTRP